MNKSLNSSDTSVDSDDNNEEKNSSFSNNDFLYMNTNKFFMEKRDSRERKIKSDQKNKKYSIPLINNKDLRNFKEEKKIKNFRSLDIESNINNDENVNLINKLVGIKEIYNQLINEKYELDYKKKRMEKKIKAIKEKITNLKNNSSSNT